MALISTTTNDPPLGDLLTSHRYFPGSSNNFQKKRPYVRKCFCPDCKEERLVLRQIPDSAPPRRHNPQPCRFAADEVDECLSLIREGKSLPGDFANYGQTTSLGGRGRASLKKRPSFKREEAFRDPSTCKTTTVSRQNSMQNGDFTDLEVAELYRLGILYDDEHVRGSGFNLEAIVHEEPVYSVRPAKRSRKHRTGAPVPEKAESVFEEIVASAGLDLDLSFADLGSDEAIAHILSGSTSRFDVLPASDVEENGRSRGVSSASAPITIIYEVDETRVPDEEEVPELTYEGDSQPATQSTDASNDSDDEEEEEGWDILPSEEDSPLPSPGLNTTTRSLPTQNISDDDVQSIATTTTTTTTATTTTTTTTPQDDAQDAWIVLG